MEAAVVNNLAHSGTPPLVSDGAASSTALRCSAGRSSLVAVRGNNLEVIMVVSALARL